ncbi:MAG: 34-kDa subunit of RNA polymerase III (C) [Piccolia ochrophora]|nr:MAG: 34-kDa subunit of RNA polymerase III (C) [Piccolia ochrophora]
MASSLADPIGKSSITELKNALYACCLQAAPDKLFAQEDLLDTGVIPRNDVNTLLECVQALLNEGHLKLLVRDNANVFKVVAKEDAQRYRSLTTDEALVYSYIDSAGREGIWTRTIKLRTNIHQSVVTRSLKSLESRGMIKQVKSVKYPTRIIYMLTSLSPSEDVTGGPWFTDGELDDVFVEILCQNIEKYLKGKTFYQPKPASKKHKSAEASSKPTTLPYPPGYTSYPSLRDIVTWVNNEGITDVPLAEDHVRQLLDILYYDRRIERTMKGSAYKALRHPADEEQTGAAKGLTEAPCGKCPVFNLCGEGGPVSATTCEYFQDWLQL